MNNNSQGKTLYMICGKTCSGKSTWVKKICDATGMQEVLTRVTRKPRYAGEDTHLFVSNEQADKEWYNAVARQNVSYYRAYATDKDIKDKDFYIICPTGLKDIKTRRKEVQFIEVYLDVSLSRRVFRAFKRGDSFVDIIKRLIFEIKEFKGYKADIIFKSGEEMYDFFVNNHYREKRKEIEKKE